MITSERSRWHILSRDLPLGASLGVGNLPVVEKNQLEKIVRQGVLRTYISCVLGISCVVSYGISLWIISCSRIGTAGTWPIDRLRLHCTSILRGRCIVTQTNLIRVFPPRRCPESAGIAMVHAQQQRRHEDLYCTAVSNLRLCNEVSEWYPRASL